MFSIFADIFNSPLVFWSLVAMGCVLMLCLLLAASYFAACAMGLIFCVPYLFWRARPVAQGIPSVKLAGMRGIFHEMANAFRLYTHWTTGKPHRIKSFAI